MLKLYGLTELNDGVPPKVKKSATGISIHTSLPCK